LSSERLIHLVAHRGSARECPENTLPAFRSALDLGVRFLELDVQLSADHVPVVIHDPQLLRTAGKPGSVFDLSADELRQIEVAETGRLGDKFRGTRIPLLSEVLALLEGRPEATIFVEIKRESLAQYSHDLVVSRILDVVRPWRAQCVLISFDLAAVYRARQLGEVQIGWVLRQYDAHSQLKCEALRPEYLFCDQRALPESGSLWRGPWHWVIYEVETLARAQALAERGASYIETMAVRELIDALRVQRN
jgi:glycerophosphoryl diester phosphodiesterase